MTRPPAAGSEPTGPSGPVSPPAGVTTRADRAHGGRPPLASQPPPPFGGTRAGDTDPTSLLPSAGAPLARPRPARLLDTDVAAVVFATTLLVVGVWSRQGGLADLTAGAAGAWSSVTRLTGLLASTAGLAGLVLVARPRSLERRYGLDRLFIWHRVLGETMAVLVGVHVAAAVGSSVSGGTGWRDAVADLTGREPYLAGATVGAVLVGVVTVSSLRSVRRRMSYETWWFVHLLAYLGLALSFMHEITLGTDLAAVPAITWVWTGAHVAVLAWLVVGRWGRLAVTAARPLTVVARRDDAPGTSTLVLGGPNLAGRRGDAGQFVFLRPLVPRLWFQPHPFSLSAAPGERGLRVTVKDRGDASRAIAALPVGTKVVVEGPYGVCTPDVLGTRRAVFVVGGVGVAPVRAILERLPAGSAPVVLYRASRTEDLVLYDELRALAEARGGRVLTLVGRTAALASRDPFGARSLLAAVPDLPERAAVVCGPESLLHAARSGLVAAGMPAARVHLERPWW